MRTIKLSRCFINASLYGNVLLVLDEMKLFYVIDKERKSVRINVKDIKQLHAVSNMLSGVRYRYLKNLGKLKSRIT